MVFYRSVLKSIFCDSETAVQTSLWIINSTFNCMCLGQNMLHVLTTKPAHHIRNYTEDRAVCACVSAQKVLGCTPVRLAAATAQSTLMQLSTSQREKERVAVKVQGDTHACMLGLVHTELKLHSFYFWEIQADQDKCGQIGCTDSDMSAATSHVSNMISLTPRPSTNPPIALPSFQKQGTHTHIEAS